MQVSIMENSIYYLKRAGKISIREKIRRGICIDRKVLVNKFIEDKHSTKLNILDNINFKNVLNKIEVSSARLNIKGNNRNIFKDKKCYISGNYNFEQTLTCVDKLKNSDIEYIDGVLKKVNKINNKEDDEGFILELKGISNNGENILEFTNMCIKICKKLLQNIFKESNIYIIVNIIDTVSNNLCKLGDALELLRNLHNNNNVILKAHEGLEKLTNFIDEINIDEKIYNFLKQKYNDNINILNYEHKEVLENMIQSMENQGVHIKEKERKKEYLELQAQEKYFSFHASSNFSTNLEGIYIEKNKLLPYIDKNTLIEYENKIKPLYKNNKIKKSYFYPTSDYIYILQDSSFLLTLLENIPEQNLREKIYNLFKKTNKDFQNNILVLQYYRNMLIIYRNFKNYNEYALKNCILNSPDKVLYFLEKVFRKILPLFFEELKFIESYIQFCENKNHNNIFSKNLNIPNEEYSQDIKNEKYDLKKNYDKTGLSSECKDGNNNVSLVTPENIFYYINKIKMEKLKKIEDKLNEHLTLYDVLSFVIKILKKCYLLDMISVIPTKGELWDEHILKFEIKKHNHIYGYIYMDLFERENKNQAIAQYTVRCSKNMNICLKYKWFDENSEISIPFFYTGIIKSEISNNMSTDFEQNDKDISKNEKTNLYRQTTSTFLVCNFKADLDKNKNVEKKSRPNENRKCNLVSDKIKIFLENIKMTLEKVNLFLHEFGHTLHCILSSTYLQHLSGNRSGADFSEFSSHLFEEYLNSYEALSLLYSQKKDENEIKNMVENYVKNKNIICYYPIVQLVIQSIVDHIFYSLSHNSNNMNERKQLIENEIKTYFLGLYYKNIFILDFFPHIHFSKTTHLIHYPSNYYCYLYCSILAKYIWNRTFKNDLYNLDSSSRIVKFLEGGSVNSSLRNIISLVETDKEKIDYYTENPHHIPLDDFFEYYQEGDKQKKYDSFFCSIIPS
ncbi:endopeptidase, putative [Plasmodium berghei]|uniref:Endopeptidase, putative n=1 Tax=Plasmodium berghei TaxID=5821 RepID=A0A1D3LXS0_PLABE|nr:endopeptidase, putative [Plasmodium berghei]